MKIGLFDFKRKREPDPEPDQGAVMLDMGGQLSGEQVEAIWDSLASDLEELSLDDLDTQLAASVAPDEELDEWADLTDEDSLRELVDSFVKAEAGLRTGADDPPGTTDAMLLAADLLSGIMEEDEGPSGSQTHEDVEVTSRAESPRAEDILAGFHAEEAALEAASSEAGETAPGEISGVVSDEVVLALMHAGIIRVAQVYDASRYRRPGEPLWRAMLELDEIDRGALLEEVATQADYPRHQGGEDLPVRNLVENMRETLPADAINAVLGAGAIPVEIGINGESLEYRLILATDDPASPVLAEAVARLPLDADIQFLATEKVEAYLDEVYPDRPKMRRAPVESLTDTASGPDASPSRPDRSPVHDTDTDRATGRPWRAERTTAEHTIDGDDPAAADLAHGSDAGLETASDTGKQNPELLDRRARKDRVVTALFKEGDITLDQVEKALHKYGEAGGREAIWRILSTVPGVDREKIFSKAARVYAFPRVEVTEGRPDHEFVLLIMETIAEERREDLLRLNLLPFEYAIDTETGGARLIFVTHDPARSDVHQLLAQLKVGRFELRYASERGLTKVITEIFPKRNEYLDRMSVDEPAFDLGTEYEVDQVELVDESALEAEMSRSTLINLFEASLVEAVRQGASDIHVFPNPKRHTEILFRVDGRLRRWHVEEKVQAEAFLAVVKDNSTNVDRFERDTAQDGFIQRRIDDILIRFRVSVIPIASANQEIRAESVVIRVLDDRKVLTDLSKLGMLDGAMERLDEAISQPHGMVILTGPTGSGKSTTLVAALHQVITPEVNVLTIEDPVEYIINGVRQIKLSHKFGLEDAIRAVLRHDPDIVMVGEMRDKPTADLAIKLANTGHLTFSTLHTNDAASAVSRLYKMGVEPFLLAYAINLVVAQRLVRQLCPTCRKRVTSPDKVLMKRLGFTPEEVETLELYEASRHDNNCLTCQGNGYKGRRAISETLPFSQEIRHLVAESGEEIDEEAIKALAVKEGMMTLRDSARELVRQGHTSLEEMMRVTASE
jgi:type II secretory ATPase GspE/PulE/Tfp pilus assembly ATPase PilB-like protein